jgi:hypothetical protein
MKLLTCPVCGYTKSGDSCPNCNADLSLIRQLQELPYSSSQVTHIEKHQPKVAHWQVVIALLLLTVGIGLGIVSSLLFAQPPLSEIPAASTVAIGNDNTSVPPAAKPIAQYHVTPGDNLSIITERLCGKDTSWQVIVQANPQLQGRENQILAGEILQQPNCED